MNSINWPLLVSKNRAKADGVPWSDEELKALAAGVPADHVRKGILTLKDSEKEQKVEDKQTAKTGEKPIHRMNIAELREKATELGLEFTPDATKAALVEIIKTKLDDEAEGGESEGDK
jgi:hypothetical protein